ncbi:MAG TPA: HAMP domain-containing sensor histidine kinase [Hyphomicrobium sp.]|nr:HAMP domain-containing sensor histidine kinase [Hyphomicrobium sp.]
MPVDGPRASLPSTAAGPEKVLAGCPDPAWIIDPAKGRVLAANAAGAARLGLRPDAASGTLDAAMPGLVRLRAMIREPLDGGRREPLVFWTAYGAENLICDVAAVSEDGESAASPELVLVSIASCVARRRPETATDAPLPAPAPEQVLPPPAAPSADDAATMLKIASAIRNGFAGGRAQPAADADDETDAADSAPSASVAAARSPHLSKLAHELRTPLSAIAAAAEIMRDERFGAIGNERYHGYTSDIHDNAKHALALINRLLSGDDAEKASGPLEPVEIDLNAVAESSVSALRPLAEEAGLKLECEFHGQLPKVQADVTTIKQVLFNLLSNAIKFTPRGGDVRVVTGLGFNRSVFIAVQDTGAGMAEQQIETALKAPVPERPQRGKDGGHGIGLPLARSLAEANGARLEIDSALGEGTAVALVFPRDRVIAHAAVSN